MCKIKRLTYEESRAKYFTKLIEAHKKALEMVEKFCPDEKIKQKRCSEQSEIIQYINDSQQALKKNEELKRLLKLAIADFEFVTKMCDETQCENCPHNYMRNYPCDCCEWQYKDEAENLLKSETLAEFQPVIHAKWEISSDGYYPYCKKCNARPENGKMTKYCPSCGAKMDGD